MRFRRGQDRRRLLVLAENQLLLPSLTSPVFAYSAHEDDTGLLFQDAAKSVPADADNDPVYTAVQVSGFGAVDGVQATTASRPLLRTGANGINGHNALSFDGSDDFLDLTGITASSGAKTFYAVYKPNVVITAQKLLIDTNATGGRFIIAHIVDVNNRTGWLDSAWRNIADVTTNTQIMCWALGSGTGTMYRDGTSIGSTTYVNRGVSNAISMGGNYLGSGNYFDGLIGAIYCYNALHDATERASMFAYLAQQWGITVS